MSIKIGSVIVACVVEDWYASSVNECTFNTVPALSPTLAPHGNGTKGTGVSIGL
jgi:hypothetical protein